jgi:predicted metal-binding membrane protein
VVEDVFHDTILAAMSSLPVRGRYRDNAKEVGMPRHEVETRSRDSRTAVALAGMLVLAGACWVVAVRQMSGMDMGASTELGSFAFFIAAWVPMMAAMMLPGAVPAVSRVVRADKSVLGAPAFAIAYLAVWTLIGLAVFVLYEPHSTDAAGALTIAAGLYELTPLKSTCRRRCRSNVRSGFRFGLYCVGSSIGLMVLFLSLGVMSVTWMVVVAAIVVGQKLLPPRAAVDVPLALAIVGLGILILVDPSAVPGLSQSM